MPTLNEWLRDQQQNGTDRQKEIVAQFAAAYSLARTDPRQCVVRLRACRTAAEQAEEPWWALFVDYTRTQVLASELREMDEAMDLAVRCAIELRKDRYQGFALRGVMPLMLLQLYIRHDPFAYENEIREALRHMEGAGGADPELRLHRAGVTANLELCLGNHAAALDAWQETLALADAVSASVGRAHCCLNLCYTLYEMAGETLSVDGYHSLLGWARAAESLLQQEEEQGRAKPRWRSYAMMWQAVALHALGETEEARRRHQAAVSVSLRVPEMPMYYQAAKVYYEMTGDWEQACAVTARFAQPLAGKGDNWTEARCLWQYCRLRRLMGVYARDDVDRALAVTRKFKDPARAVRVFTRDATLFADVIV